MTTRSGKKWLLVYASSPDGSFVARRDSPAGKAALRDDLLVSQFRTLGGDYARLRALRGP